MFQRFQRTYEALEQEGMAERKQLVSLHQQRVQADLNEKKRHALEKYMTVLQRDIPDVSTQVNVSCQGVVSRDIPDVSTQVDVSYQGVVSRDIPDVSTQVDVSYQGVVSRDIPDVSTQVDVSYQGVVSRDVSTQVYVQYQCVVIRDVSMQVYVQYQSVVSSYIPDLSYPGAYSVSHGGDLMYLWRTQVHNKCNNVMNRLGYMVRIRGKNGTALPCTIPSVNYKKPVTYLSGEVLVSLVEIVKKS